ncbi:MAG: hypothetical protein IAE99_08220 [Rhodothermales bacterium]|nr:hypothetical protein [Rhodothermales bacterium]
MLYRIHVPLDNHKGAKSGRLYTCSPEALVSAPEGEFKGLPARAYSVFTPPPTSAEPQAAPDAGAED